MGINALENFAKISYILYVLSLSEGVFGQKSWKLTNQALLKLFMHMKTHFSSIYLLQLVFVTFFSTTLILSP